MPRRKEFHLSAPVSCPRCGTANAPDNRFCAKCGFALAPAPPTWSAPHGAPIPYPLPSLPSSARAPTSVLGVAGAVMSMLGGVLIGIGWILPIESFYIMIGAGWILFAPGIALGLLAASQSRS